jgi:hypothetical protein
LGLNGVEARDGRKNEKGASRDHDDNAGEIE